MKRIFLISYYFLEMNILQIKCTNFFIMQGQAFKYAWQGIKSFIQTERNAKIHLIALLTTIALGFVLHINKTEWAIITICIALVFIAEMINSAIEKTADLYTTLFEPKIKYIKDVAAGAVLIAAFTSTIIGAIIFIPKIYNYAF